MSSESLETAGVILVTVPAIELGGVTLLRLVMRNIPGYFDNPLRKSLFRAGHAHAGVLVILALVALVYIDETFWGTTMRTVIKSCLVAAPILMPAGFFLSVASAETTRPNRLIGLVYVGAAALGLGSVLLGIGLLL